MGLAQPVENRLELAQLIGCGEPAGVGRRDGVDPSESSPYLLPQSVPSDGPLVVAQDLSRNGLAVQTLHHHARATEHLAVVALQDFGHGNSLLPGQSEQAGLGADGHASGAGGHARAKPLEYQASGVALTHQIKRPCLTGGPTRQPTKVLDRGVLTAEERRERVRQFV